ncbi:MAG: hypothetical protein NTY53_05330 [Kiritimatiellaeota bacterium]|nr:hypothetical protein [Kiritimatiellota bacterium]
MVTKSFSDGLEAHGLTIQIDPLDGAQSCVLQETALVLCDGVRTVNGGRDRESHVIGKQVHFLHADVAMRGINGDIPDYLGLAAEKVGNGVSIERGVKAAAPIRQSASKGVMECFAPAAERLPPIQIPGYLATQDRREVGGNEFMLDALGAEIQQCRVMKPAEIEIVQHLRPMRRREGFGGLGLDDDATVDAEIHKIIASKAVERERDFHLSYDGQFFIGQARRQFRLKDALIKITAHFVMDVEGAAGHDLVHGVERLLIKDRNGTGSEDRHQTCSTPNVFMIL